MDTINHIDYKFQLTGIVFGRLGHIHKLVLCGLQLAGLNTHIKKKNAKRLAKFCLVCVITDTLFCLVKQFCTP